MPKHQRAIQIDAYAREDGPWDIDARISDIKTRDAHLASGLRPAGAPLHNLLLRVTIDTHFNVNKPFQLDNCHALRTDGLAVAKYYPRWAVRQTVKSEPS
jgi:hypothetical protein